MSKTKILIGKIFSSVFTKLPEKIASAAITKMPYLAKFINDDRDVLVEINNNLLGKVTLLLHTGYKIDSRLINDGYYDLKTLMYLKRILKKGDVCIDVGANIGAISISMRHIIGESGKLFCFEPGPILFQRLKKNIELNSFQNVTIYNYGLSDIDGVLYWMFDPNHPGNAYLSDKGDIKVPVKRLDDCDFMKNERVDFMKVDVEGMELEVFLGAIELIKKNKPTILYESVVEGQFEKYKQVDDLLKSLGYKFYEINIREEDLQPDTKFDFIPTHFPRLPQNTLAVHPDRERRLD